MREEKGRLLCKIRPGLGTCVLWGANWLPAPTRACLVCRVGAALRGMQENPRGAEHPSHALALSGLGAHTEWPLVPLPGVSGHLHFYSSSQRSLSSPIAKPPDVLARWEAFAAAAALEQGGFSGFSDFSVPGRGSLNTSVVWQCRALYLGST